MHVNDLTQALKLAFEEILEETVDCEDCLNCENSWDIVATAASNALELIEKAGDDPLSY